jgi:SAM-dependent methyltransferase
MKDMEELPPAGATREELDSHPNNPFDYSRIAATYESWYAGPGRRADQLEKRLLGKLLSGLPKGGSILEVGCGTGHFTRWFHSRGYQASGLDSSSSMLANATRIPGVNLIQGDALTLPFPDDAFDAVAFITTLEFIEDPYTALKEAVRVAKKRIILGVLNRNSLLGWRRKSATRPPWDRARFLSPNALSDLITRSCAGDSPRIWWQTTLWPLPFVHSLPLPWGGFIGMRVELQPKSIENQTNVR